MPLSIAAGPPLRDAAGHNAALTDNGYSPVESAFGCGNLFDERNLVLHTAVQEWITW